MRRNWEQLFVNMVLHGWRWRETDLEFQNRDPLYTLASGGHNEIIFPDIDDEYHFSLFSGRRTMGSMMKDLTG